MRVLGRKRIICSGTLFSQFNVTSNTAFTVITPAANVKGCVIKRLCGYVSSSTYINAYADTAAPGQIWDVTKKLVFSAGQAGTATSFNLNRELEIPAGVGFYIYAQGGGGHNIFCLWEPLP